MLSIEKAMEHSQMGYARHKVVYDESGKPADYIFLSINHAFERLTGTKKEDILNRRITQVMPKITQGEFDWIGYYGDIAETGQNKVFEQYSYPLDKWYRVEAFSCEKGYFTTLFTDITHERELTEASKDFLNDGKVSNTYDQITQRMKRITGADYVALNVFLEEGGHFQTMAIVGVPDTLQKAFHLLGFNPEKKEWPPDPYRFELIKDNRVTTFAHLHELTRHVLSKKAIQLLEKTFHLGQTVIVKSTHGERIIGDFTLMFTKGKQLQNKNEAIIYADMVGMLIENRNQQRKLEENEDRFNRAIEGTGAGLWDWDMVKDCVFFSKRWKSMLGYEDHEVKNNFSGWKSLWHPDDAPRIEKALNDYLQGKTNTYLIEHCLRHKDGSWRWISTRGDIEKDATGKPIRWTGTNIDITPAKEAEEELQNNYTFQKIISTISTTFVKSSKESFDEDINDMLAKIGLHFTVDRSYLFLFSDDLTTMTNTHEWCSEGVEPQKENIQNQPVDSLPWWKKQVFEEEVVHIPSVEQLPQEALAEKKEFFSQSIKSLLTIPVKSNHKVWGFIGFDAVKRHYQWNEHEINNLIVISSIIANLLLKLDNEKQLEESKQQLKTIVSNTPAVIYTYEIDTKGNPNITFLNEKVKKVLGFEPDDFIGNTSFWESCVHPEDLPKLQEKLSGKNITNEYRFQDKNGNFHWLLDKQKILRKEEGFLEIIGTWWDITKRKMAEEKLSQLLSNKELTTDISSVFVNTPVEKTDQAIEHVLQSMAQFFKVDRIGIFQISHDGLYLNNTYEYCAQKVPSIQEHLQQIQLKHEEKLKSLDPCVVEAMILKAKPKAQKREKNACSSLVVVNMLNDGKNSGFIYFDSGCRQKERLEDDLSQIKFLTEIISNAISKKELTESLMEARKHAEEANQAKSMFLANMNHELRTPLNGIIGFSDMLKHTSLNEEQKSFVDVVYSSAKHLLEVIRDILDFSRIEAGKFELFPEKTEIRKLIEETFSIVRYRAETKGLALHNSIGTKVPKFVEVDGARLKQILVNLLTNAIKFTDDGSVQLIVRQLEKPNRRVRLAFQVTDTGIGIKEKDQTKIFEPFHQADMPAEKRAIGTGLGLAITKDLLEKMGSSLQLKSIYGQGSTFSFQLELPFEPSVTKNKKKIDIETIHNHSIYKYKKVLIVEDNPVNMQYAQTAIGMLSTDLQMLIAKNGQEGYEQYRKHHPDLILMDIRMPKLNGYELTAMIRAQDTETPIVAMTAKALKKDKEYSQEVGMNDFLSKPVSVDQLKKLLIKYL